MRQIFFVTLTTILFLITAFWQTFHLPIERLKPKNFTKIHDIQIYSHRGFNATLNNVKQWIVSPENTLESLEQALEEFDGCEFDVHAFKTLSGQVIPGLLHDDFLGLYGQPNQSTKSISWEEAQALPFSHEFAQNELRQKWKEGNLVIRYNKPPQIVHLARALQVISPNKMAFCEIKTGSKNPFMWPGLAMPKAVLAEHSKNDNLVVISFYWWAPFLAKHLAAQEGRYLKTGIDVVDFFAKPLFVKLAALFKFDYFMPPHDQVDLDLIRACKKNKIALVSWTRGSLKDEQQQLLRISGLYGSLGNDQKPELGIIVNRSYKDSKSLLN